MRTFIITALLCISMVAGAVEPDQQAIFTAGEDGYACYRIPAIVQTNQGTVLAFCEGRKNGCSDTGDIDIVLRRSVDGGKSWGPLELVADFGDDVIGNPAPLVDPETGTIWLTLTSNKGDGPEKEILQGKAPHRRVWVAKSEDVGQTWTKPIGLSLKQ